MWKLLLNDDEAMIANVVRDALTSELPLERLRPNAAPIDDQAFWTTMAALGWFGVGLPEDVGGAGLSIVEEMLIQRESGAVLASPCLMATVLAGHVAWLAGNFDLARELVSGRQRVALAIDAKPDATGTERQVCLFDWVGPEPLLFWNDKGMGIFLPSSVSAASEADCFDDSVTMHLAKLSTRKPVAWVAADEAPLPLRAQVLISAALVGLAARACHMTVNYAKVREQFGKPIGSFQAIKHRCADMAVRLRLAWSQTSLAALKLQAGAGDAAMHVASAKLLAAEAALENGRAAIQIHGGIGFQSECDAHWFLKRAMVYDQAGGAMAIQAERVAVAPEMEW